MVMDTLKTMAQRLSACDRNAGSMQVVRWLVLAAQATGKAEDRAEAMAAFAEIEPEVAAFERRKQLEREAPELAAVEAEIEREAFAAELHKRGSMTGSEVRAFHRRREAVLTGRVMVMPQRPTYGSPVSVVRARKVNLGAQAQAQRGDAEADADGLTGSNGRHKDKLTGDSGRKASD